MARGKHLVRWGWLVLSLALLVVMAFAMFRSEVFVSVTGKLYRKRMVVYLLPPLLLFGLSFIHPKKKCRHHALSRGSFMVLAILLATCAFQRITSEWSGNPMIFMEWPNLLINMAIVASFFMLVWAFVWNVKYAAICGYWLMFVLAYAYHCVSVFRGISFRPLDVLSIKTAVAVAGQYQYPLAPIHLFWFACGAVLCALSGWVPSQKNSKLWGRFVKLGCLIASVMWMLVLSFTPLLFNMGLSTSSYESVLVVLNRKQGTLATFMMDIWYLTQYKQENYDATQLAIQEPRFLTAEMSGDLEQRPNVVVIMNESLADLTSLWQIETNDDPLKFWRSLAGQTVQGNVYLTSYGGGTCNTEHSFLTATPPRPNLSLPVYSILRENTPSLAWQLKAQDYTTVAFHPHFASNYQRNLVYPLLGFDTFISLEDLEEPELLRPFVSDRACYLEIIQLFENKREDERLFVFNVTMQNHSGYTTGLLDGIRIENGNTGFSAIRSLEEYLNCVAHSDKALETLLAYFDAQEEPTVILIFGDHQPAFDLSTFAKRANLTPLETQITQQITPFMIWANYPIETGYVPAVSIHSLSALLLQTAGMLMSEYDQWLLETSDLYPVVLGMGYAESGGQFVLWEDADFIPERLKMLDDLRYNRLHDSEHRLPALTTLLCE